MPPFFQVSYAWFDTAMTTSPFRWGYWIHMPARYSWASIRGRIPPFYHDGQSSPPLSQTEVQEPDRHPVSSQIRTTYKTFEFSDFKSWFQKWSIQIFKLNILQLPTVGSASCVKLACDIVSRKSAIGSRLIIPVLYSFLMIVLVADTLNIIMAH